MIFLINKRASSAGVTANKGPDNKAQKTLKGQTKGRPDPPETPKPPFPTSVPLSDEPSTSRDFSAWEGMSPMKPRYANQFVKSLPERLGGGYPSKEHRC